MDCSGPDPSPAWFAPLAHAAGPPRTLPASPSPSRIFALRRVKSAIENPLSARIVWAVEAKDAKLSFEAALTRLESVVESMESGEVPLAELLAKFEEGNKLLKICEARLKDAELKIEQLKQTKEGAVFTKFEAARES
jgi:exodeoxyribonuclease VII small subunit